MNYAHFKDIVRPGAPVSADLLARLEGALPPVAREALSYALIMLERGRQLNALMIEKDGRLGLTNFDPIAADRSGITFMVYQDALNRMGVTAAASVFEATIRVGKPGARMPAADSEPQDAVVLAWWVRGEGEGSWHFGVDSMGPQPRKLLMQDLPTSVISRFAGLVEPFDLALISPGTREGFRKASEMVSTQLRPLIDHGQPGAFSGPRASRVQ